jgi:anti-sigma regulatory factor (Ser/Thr protein kinase)
MDMPESNSRRSCSGLQRRPGGAGGGSRAAILGSLTIPGRPEHVAAARAFVARTLSANQVDTDNDSAALLTSEIVTNAITHTKSGIAGGTVTIIVIGIPHGVLIEVVDDGSAGTPIVKGDLYASDGHGLYLVQHLAARWVSQRSGRHHRLVRSGGGGRTAAGFRASWPAGRVQK